jgi:hypothetical protein
MPCPPELYYGAEILFWNWQCLTDFDWCELLDTVVSMKMRRPTHLQVLLVSHQAQSRLDEILSEAA